MEFSTYFTVASPAEPGGLNTAHRGEDFAAVHMRNINIPVNNGETDCYDLTLLCPDKNACIQRYWYRGAWQDGIVTYWHEVNHSDTLRDRVYDGPREPGAEDHSTILTTVKAGVGETASSRFILTWNVPNNYNYWSPCKDENGKDKTWKNHYATIWENSLDSAVYSAANYDSLYERTCRFRDILFATTVDPAVIDAAASTMSVLKTATTLRLENGEFYGWEGCMEIEGSCSGTCSHVWNYAYALCFLFPSLERSIRDLECHYSTGEDGGLTFRLTLPVGRERGTFRPCVDGQMGSIIKTWREWKISGDTDWLRDIYPIIRRQLAYTWNPENGDAWDLDRDGVLEGRQHHTLDMELFGPSSWLEGFYLAALRCAAEMAEHLGYAEEAADYRALYEKGYKWTKENLFNGEYFIQKCNLNDKSVIDRFGADNYWNAEAGEIKYQICEGSAIDQLCAQWHAAILGLGDIFDREQIQTAVRSLFKNNFKPSMRAFSNPWRNFAINDESGAIICDYPEGKYKPVIPISYCEEAMHGFEYQLAGLLISEGLIDEGLTIVHSVRDRYAGYNRNPYNEIECGSNYARSMASFALIPLLAGFRFDMVNGMIGFSPRVNADSFSCFFGLGSGWGQFTQTKDTATVQIAEGVLPICRVELPCFASVSEVTVNGESVPFTFADGAVTFAKADVRELSVRK